MRNRLESFFMDNRYRWLTYAVSGVAAVCYASVRLLVFHVGKAAVSLETVIIYCLFLCIGIGLYSTFSHAQPKASSVPVETSHLHQITVLAVIALGLGIVILPRSNVLPKLQAAVITARIESSDKSLMSAYRVQPPDRADAELRNRFEKLQTIADTASRYQIPVDASYLLNADAKIRNSLRKPPLSSQTKQAGLIAAAKLGEFAAVRKTEADTQDPPGYFIASDVPIVDQQIRYMGARSPLVFDGGEFSIQNSTVVFDGIDFNGRRPFSQSPLVLDSKSVVVVRNGSIRNIEQTLDGITWVNVQFEHSMIKLNGGPFTLVDVSFKDCDLRWLPPNGPLGGQVGYELRERITRADGHPFTFASEGGQGEKSH